MTDWPVHGTITGPIVMIGFGSIGRGTLPLIERHFRYDRKRFTVIDPVDADRGLLDERGIRLIQDKVTRDNMEAMLRSLLEEGEGQPFIVNLSVEVSSVAVMRLAHEVGALYVDTVAEPWPGFYTDTSLSVSQRSNYALREAVLDLKREFAGRGPTAVNCCGANPGMVSWFVKQALLNLAGRPRPRHARPAGAGGMGRLGAEGRRQGHPHRRARHPAGRQAEADGNLRQHMVGRGLRLRGAAAGRAGAGAPTRRLCRRRVAATISGPTARSISCGRAPAPASAHGAPRPRRSTAFS